MLVQHKAAPTTRSITTRMCLRCGYDGEELQPTNEIPAFVCPDCCEDLYARPPQSYAQLEMLVCEPEADPPGRTSIGTVLIAGPRAIASWIGRLLRPQPD